jgi:hypothetical protein
MAPPWRLARLARASVLLLCLPRAWGGAELLPGPLLREIAGAAQYSAASGRFCSDGIETGQATDMCNLASPVYPEGSAADMLMAGR